MSTLSLVLTLFWALGFPPISHGQEDASLGAEAALMTDAQSYADDFGVDLNEAVHRLRLQPLIGTIGGAIERNEPHVYGGHWIEHVPEFRVILALTQNDHDLVSRYFVGTELESITVARIVRYSRRELVDHVERLAELRDADWTFDIELNEIANGIDIYVVDEYAFLAQASVRVVELPPMARLSVVGGLARPATTMYAGRSITSCTSGFSARSSTYGDGLTTAYHCPHNFTWNETGEKLTTLITNKTHGHDEQFARRSDATFPNKAWDGNPDWRLITGKTSRYNISVGDYICKFGMATKYGCGNVVSRNAHICGGSGGSTGIRVHNSNNKDLSSGGDSGGPWYLSETAYGIMSCAAWVDPHGYIDGIFVAANYVEGGLNVTIKTSP